MKGLLLRNESTNSSTTGKLILPWIKEHPTIYTMEKAWKDNKKNISCIPIGIYVCKPHVTINRKGIKRDTWQLQNVKDRSGINFDIANYAHELLGCIAVGFGIADNKQQMITNSANAMGYLLTNIGKNTTWELEIKNLN